MKPLLESLFSEMTVLGFLGVITFLVSKVGVLSEISVVVFGESEEEFLTELLETVHYVLFGVMCFFILQVWYFP